MHLLRPAVLTAVVLAAGAVPGAPVHADTPALGYSCTLPVIGARTFPMVIGTNAPATVYLGTSFTPTLTTVVQVPPEMADLMANELGAATVDGTISGPVRTGGSTTTVVQTIRSTPIPPSNAVPFPVTARGTLPRITASAPGTVTYLPGDLEVTLNFKKPNGSPTTPIGSFANLDCTMPATSATIDKVALAKSPTRVAGSAGYAKAKKKVTAVATVSATSRLVPAGTVTAVLRKGKARLRTVTATLSKGRATVVFPGKRAKGTYAVVITYPGSSTMLGSTTTRTFTVR
jgi:hypothetical protein